MRIKMAASAAVVMVAAATMTAAPAQARTIRVEHLPPRYQTVDTCIDFTPTVMSRKAWVTDVKVHGGGVGVPAFYCPTGWMRREMSKARGVKFTVRYQVFDGRAREYINATYRARVRFV